VRNSLVLVSQLETSSRVIRRKNPLYLVTQVLLAYCILPNATGAVIIPLLFGIFFL
jgi:hypothetical protein